MDVLLLVLVMQLRAFKFGRVGEEEDTRPFLNKNLGLGSSQKKVPRALRRPFKLIVMSATLDGKQYLEFFEKRLQSACRAITGPVKRSISGAGSAGSGKGKGGKNGKGARRPWQHRYHPYQRHQV